MRPTKTSNRRAVHLRSATPIALRATAHGVGPVASLRKGQECNVGCLERREGGREGSREGSRESGRESGREGSCEGSRESGCEGSHGGGREGSREGSREGGHEGIAIQADP